VSLSEQRELDTFELDALIQTVDDRVKAQQEQERKMSAMSRR
jgi:hypothetical protein